MALRRRTRASRCPYKPFPLAIVKTHKEVEAFRRASLAGMYYAPFNMNSKNYRHIPEQTREWFDKLGNLLLASVQLTTRGDHLQTVTCFKILYELIAAMEEGQEIVFADEVGSWMIPGDERQFIAAYMTSLAAIATPEEFAAAALPLLRRDSWQSFATQAYTAAITAATEAQRLHLEAQTREQKIRTGRTP